MFVVSPFGSWQGGIMLHPDVEDVSWVACNSTKEACSAGYSNQLRKAWLLSSRRYGFLETLIHAEPSSGVRQLTKYGGGQLERLMSAYSKVKHAGGQLPLCTILVYRLSARHGRTSAPYFALLRHFAVFVIEPRER